MGDANDEDDELYREAGEQLIGRWFVLQELIFNRLDVLHREWRSAHGVKE
jgi:hypothetical protein